MAPFNFDGTGIDADSKGTNKVLPKGWYDVKVIEFVSKAGDTYPKEGRTKNNDPMVNILCEVELPAEFKGERVFHTVTFLPKGNPGAGMSVHFLKTIGEPFEGKFSVETNNWVGKVFSAYVIQEEYNGKKKNKIGEIKAVAVDPQSPEKKRDDLPF